MVHTRLTLLVEDLADLAGAIPGGKSFPSIELLLSRADFLPAPALGPDAQRMSLFGLPAGKVPVAALTRLADGNKPMPAGRYWLRADAVSQQADMIRVFMTGAGLDGFSPQERQELCSCIEQVLEDEGLEHCAGPNGRWTLSLESPPGFGFMPLEEALGLDMADALPAEHEARYWRRIMNEAQVALHNNPVNADRRQGGEAVINGIWIWGGGHLPEPARERVFNTVFAQHPVSRGLALLNSSILRDTDSFEPSEVVHDGTVLLDWTVESRDAIAELDRLESLVRGLLTLVRKGSLSLQLVEPGGRNWALNRKSARRIWRRPAPFTALLERFTP